MGFGVGAASADLVTVSSWNDELYGFEAIFIPDFEGEVVRAHIELDIEIYEGYDPTSLLLTLQVPLVGETGETEPVLAEWTAADLGLTGVGSYTIDIETGVFNGEIATEFPNFWVTSWTSTDNYFGPYGFATGAFSLEIVPAPASLTGLALAGLLAHRRRHG